MVENAKIKAKHKIVKKCINGFFIFKAMAEAIDEGQKYPQKNLEIVKFNPNNNPTNKATII